MPVPAPSGSSQVRPSRVYRIELSRRAAKILDRLPDIFAQRIRQRIDALAVAPRPRGLEKLEGTENVYRVREGDFRILYEIHDRVLLVLVLEIGNRREVYR